VGMKRLLLVLLGALGAVPVATGLLAIFGGAESAPGGGPVPASVDSEYRFVNVFWVAAGLILWWTLRRPLERALVTRVVLAIVVAGGVARVISVLVVGWPHPVYIGAMVVELVVVPLLIVWHARQYPIRRAAG